MSSSWLGTSAPAGMLRAGMPSRGAGCCTTHRGRPCSQGCLQQKDPALVLLFGAWGSTPCAELFMLSSAGCDPGGWYLGMGKWHSALHPREWSKRLHLILADASMCGVPSDTTNPVLPH